MSLPSVAIFIKDGVGIAKTFINVGWSITEDRIIKCAYEAYNQCLEQEQSELEGKPKLHTAKILNGWKSFDHIFLYGILIPKTMMDNLFKGIISHEQFCDMIRFGNFKPGNTNIGEINQELEVKLNEKYKVKA